MDDLIVLILTLIFIVAGIFGQMKKRQVPDEPVGEDHSRRQNLWEILEDEEEEPVGVTQPMQPAEEGGRVDRFHTASQMIKRQFIPKVNEPAPDTKQTIASKRKKFPLKQAVIYSEILNRKYF